ncbi:unnamed protein product, partial [Mesorhabditis belari]|uniref:non-specific serine/threonine protein kinase n=1 Tax=Mesorhabditis belari TaxID=2138241 RepID=A0AAF3F5E9_9BILA
MWALGCIMYESMCLQKAFDADSLPALVNKICKSQFEPVRGPYSNGLKLLVRDLLSLETTTRPAATAALQRLARGRVAAPFRPKLRGGPARSTLYRMDISTMALEAVDSMPTKTQIRQVSLSSNHFIAVCSSGEVFTWGENGQGQLGLGDTHSDYCNKSRFSKYRNSPGRVESLREMRIQCAAAGMGFSFFCADRGTLWACGDGGMCQSGEGSKLVSPCLIDALFSSNVLEVACGDEHVVVLCEGGGIWAWGRSQPFTIKPQQIEIPNNVSVVAIRCGPDASALITVDGTLIAWGVNKHNKLNLAKRQGFFAREPKNAYEFIEKPTLVKGFPARVVDVTIGRHHTGVILETGTVHMFGRNSWGELGLGGLGPQPQPCAHFPVKGLLQKTCLHIVCGEGFSLASTAEQELFFWGSKGVRIEEVEQNKNEKWGEKRNGVSVHHLVPNPSLVLRLDSSPSSGISIGISGLVADGRTAMLLIDTVAIRDPPPTANNRTPTVSQSAQLATRAKFSSDSDPTAVATWLRREMDEATFIAHRRNSSAGDLPKPEKKAFSAKEKPRRSGSLQRQQHGHTVVGVEKKLPAVDAPPRYEELAPRSQKITKSTTCSIL